MAGELEASRRETEPKTVTLGGETFECVPTVAFGALVDFGEAGFTRVAMWQFLHAAVVDADIPAMEAVLRRKEEPITDDDVFDAVTGLVAVYTGRPTTRPSASRGGPQKTGRKSKAGSSSEEGTASVA